MPYALCPSSENSSGADLKIFALKVTPDRRRPKDHCGILRAVARATMFSLDELRRTPALLKLDLYCRGMRILSSCDTPSKTGRGVMRTRAGLGSGLELILPNDLWTNVPVAESFGRSSPYALECDNDQFRITRDGEVVTPVQLAPRPKWYDRLTSSGKKMTRVGTLQGTYLAIYPAKICDYWLRTPEKTQCRFCSVGLNLGVDDDTAKSVDEVMEVVHAARAESHITYVDFNTGHYDGDTYLDLLEPYITRIKAETGLLVGVQTPPHPDLRRYDRLRQMGVNRVSFCFEIYDRELFREVCPGKHAQYGMDRYLDAIRYCADLGKRGPITEPWVVNGEIIAGLEPPESSIRAINWVTSVGAVPTVCVFRPLAGTDYAHKPPPDAESLVPVFTRLYDACMEAGLPIGCAPNIHVSLVMLPEECAGLSRKRYPLRQLKLSIIKRLLRRRLKRAEGKGSASRL